METTTVNPETTVWLTRKEAAAYLRLSPATLANWASIGFGVRDQLTVELAGIENITLIALAGEQYRTVLLNIPWPYEVPMKGLGIGKQLGWLTAQISTDPGQSE